MRTAGRSSMKERSVQYVAFLRAVMVGRKGLSLALLLEAFESCGAQSPRSFLATGNVIFRTKTPPARFSLAVARAIQERTGIHEPVFLRTPTELERLQKERPFDRAPLGPRHELTVTFLPAGIRSARRAPISGPRGDVEVFWMRTREAFAITRLVGGRPGNPGAQIERLLGVKVTTRNWNTIVRLLSASRSAR